MTDSGQEEQRVQEADTRNESDVAKVFLQRALEITEESDRTPLLSLVSLLNPNPVSEWGAADYARAIGLFVDIEGTNEEKTVANQVRNYLQGVAHDNGIDQNDLAQSVAAQSETGRRLNDFVQDIYESLDVMTPPQQLMKSQELHDLRGTMGDEFDVLFAQPRTSQQGTPPILENAHQVFDDPEMDWHRQEFQQQQEAKKRIYEEQGEDMALYEGTIAQTLQMRFDRIMDPHTRETEERLLSYFADIQRWVGIVLRNDARENKEGKLTLTNERYARFKEIISKKAPDMTLEEVRSAVSFLRDDEKGRLTRYFKQADLKDNDRTTRIIGYGKEPSSAYGLPNSIEEVMDMIQRQYGSRFATGGEFELIDVNGEFHIENFYHWARERTNFIRKQNPVDEINSLRDITIRTSMSAIPLDEILQSPQYRKHREFEIMGDENASDQNDPRNVVDGHWGREVDHPKFTEERANDLYYELGFFAADHSFAVNYHYKRGEKDSFLEVMQRHMRGWQARGNWYELFFKRPSRKDNSDKEYENFFDNGKDGTLGRAMRELLVAYTHMTEFTDFSKYQDGDRRLQLKDGVKRTIGERKIFKDNFFYKYLEADGANTFLLTLAEESLSKNTEIREQYSSFLRERIDAAAANYRGRNLSTEQEERLRQLVDTYKNRLKGAKEVSFTESDDLISFHTQVDKMLFGKKSDVQQLQLSVQKDIYTNLNKGFFKKVMDVDVDKYDREGILRGKEKVRDILGEHFFDENFNDDIELYEQYVDYRRSGKTPPNITTEAFENYVKKNEKFADKLVDTFAKRSRKDLNYFRYSSYHYSKTELLDTALEKAICRKALGLNKVDSEYALRWSKSMLYPFGIAGANDTTWTGFDYYTRILRSSKYMEAQNRKGYPIVEPFIKEVQFLGSNMFDMMMIRRSPEDKPHETMMDLFRGGMGDNIVERDKRLLPKDATMFELAANSQMDLFNNDIKNAADFIDKLRKGDFHFDKITKTDMHGNVIIDTKRAVEEFTKLWTMIRYSTDQHKIDYSRMVNIDGKLEDLMHHQFGKHTRALLQLMHETVYQDDPKAMYERPGIGVFAALVGAVIEDHRGTAYEKRWTIQQINEMEFLISAIIQKDPNVKKYKTRIPPQVWNALLAVHGIGYKKMMAIEGGYSLLEALYFAVLEGVENYTELVSRPLKA